MRLYGDFKQTHKQPLWSNLWASDMTCWRQPGHWEGFKCLLMSSSDSPQLCCWMLIKTWSNSVTFSSPSDYSFTLLRAACRSLCTVIQDGIVTEVNRHNRQRVFESEAVVTFADFFLRAEEVVLEILTWRWGQTQVKIINGPIPSICGVDISFSASRERDQHKGSKAIGALSDLAEGNWLSNVYREVCAEVCLQVFHDCMFKSQ